MLNTRKVSLQLPYTVELAGDYRLRYSLSIAIILYLISPFVIRRRWNNFKQQKIRRNQS